MAQSYLKPPSKGFRQPTDNTMENGNIVNPPRYAELGGVASASNGSKANRMTVKKPGATIAK